MTRKRKIKKAKFVNELYLFSNKLQPDAENWFKSSVVEQIDLSKFDHQQLEVCALFNECLKQSGRHFKYALRVINYKPKALMLVKLSGVFEKALRIDDKNTLKDLIKSHRAMYHAYQAHRSFNISLSSISIAQRNSGFLADLALKNELKALRSNLKKQDIHFRTTITALNKAFYSAFSC